MRNVESQKYPILSDVSEIPIPTRRRIDRIYVHHSLSPFGDAELIEQWHLDNNYNSIGYNFVITKCERNSDGFPEGFIQLGRDVNIRPAQVLGDNKYTIGVCLIGLYDEEGYKDIKGEKWLWWTRRAKAVCILLATLCKKLELTPDKILGHREAGSVKGVSDPKKTCPGMSLNLTRLRASVRFFLRVESLYDYHCRKYAAMIGDFKEINPQYLYFQGDDNL